MADTGDSWRHALVFGHRLRHAQRAGAGALTAGHDVLFDIDLARHPAAPSAGARRRVTIFVLPPSRAELERRLHTRAQDSAEVVAKRMAKANDEISHWAEYDYVIVNEDVARARAQVETILVAERLKACPPAGNPRLRRRIDERRVKRNHWSVIHPNGIAPHACFDKLMLRQAQHEG